MKQRWAIVLGIVIIMGAIGRGLPDWTATASSDSSVVSLPLVMRDDPWGWNDPTPTIKLPPPTPTINELALRARAHEDHFLVLVNETRSNQGTARLVVDTPCLKAAAQRHARDIAVDPDNRYWNNKHRGSDGSLPHERAIDAGCPPEWGFTEIMAAAPSAENALYAFSSSPLHWLAVTKFGNRMGIAFEPAVISEMNLYIVVAVMANDRTE